jgi:hypothetical protein
LLKPIFEQWQGLPAVSQAQQQASGVLDGSQVMGLLLQKPLKVLQGWLHASQGFGGTTLLPSEFRPGAGLLQPGITPLGCLVSVSTLCCKFAEIAIDLRQIGLRLKQQSQKWLGIMEPSQLA